MKLKRLPFMSIEKNDNWPISLSAGKNVIKVTKNGDFTKNDSYFCFDRN